MADEKVIEMDDEKVQTLRAQFEAEYNTRLESQVSEITQKLVKENEKNFKEQMEKIRSEMAPPSEQDIQKLLTQEYLEFKVPLVWNVKGERRQKEFIIRELSQSTEKKILTKIKKILVPVASELSSMSLNLLDGDAAKKVIHLMNTFEPMLDALAEVAQVSLNPFDEDDEITVDWVKDNLSSTKIVKIVTAQMEANYMRDFLSLLFRGTKLAQ